MLLTHAQERGGDAAPAPLHPPVLPQPCQGRGAPGMGEGLSLGTGATAPPGLSLRSHQLLSQQGRGSTAGQGGGFSHWSSGN